MGHCSWGAGWGISGWKINKRRYQDLRGVLLNEPNRILCWIQAKGSTIMWGWWMKWKPTKYGGGGFSLNWLSRALAKTRFYKEVDSQPGRRSGSLAKVWSSKQSLLMLLDKILIGTSLCIVNIKLKLYGTYSLTTCFTYLIVFYTVQIHGCIFSIFLALYIWAFG